MMKRIAILVSTGFTVISQAQVPESLQPPVVATAAAARPAHGCLRPEPPGRLALVNQVKTYNKDVLAYRDCLQAFVKAQGELVKMHTEIGNSAVNEYNAFVTEMSKKKPDTTK